ncbi:zinc-binding dehydrogenase [Glutamicibacter sp.]|uniref:zinc-binding dehydrogenase n=1 Tax=Glutamicibacter sp. TaxID=1931995 RepID=UPI002B47BA45|nr:zinc-binding dehydrogenase [Glutamicibacter sp.]HJX79314.1 zinc-binding dehydrogenase [Glutamicibacter sp.]
MSQGKLAAMSGVRNIEIREYPLPTPASGQVLMQVSKANICGSDIHMWEGKHIFRDHVMGHEMTGVIQELGEGVTTDSAGTPVQPGDRIVPVYYQTCRRCAACTQGLFNICERGSDFMGAPAANAPHFTGGFATHYVVQADQYFYKVPDAVSDAVAAGANCGFAQMLYVMDQCGPLGGRTVVVQGAGGVGLFTSAIASLMGATVVVIDSVAVRLQEALRFGASHVINMVDVPTMEGRALKVAELTGSAPDVVVDVTGVPAALNEAIRLVRLGGQVVEVGSVSVDESQSVSILPGLITRKCLTVRGTLRYQPWYLLRALNLLAAEGHRFPFETLTDRVYTLAETQLAMERAANREVARAIIEPNAVNA